MITPDGWFDWALRDAGPLSKTNGGHNTVKGFVPHSAEGYWPHLGVLLHSPSRQASWGASNLKDGRLYQHYPVFAQTWTSGAGYPNNNFFSNETEGVKGESLTEKQIRNIVRQIEDLSALKGWTPKRPKSATDKTATLYEHRECVRWGAEPTACPSNRIPWDRILSDLEGDDMKPFLCWDSTNQRVFLIGPFGSAWITTAQDVKALEALYGPMKVALTEAAIKAIGAAA